MDGSLGDPRLSFARRLRALLRVAQLSIRGLERLSATTMGLDGKPAGPLRRGTIAGMISEKRPTRPEWGNVTAFILTCLRHAKEHGHPVAEELADLEGWRTAYLELLEQLDADRSGLRAARQAFDRKLRLSAPPITDWDAAELGIHQAIGGGPLPEYIPRDHDEQIRNRLDAQNSSGRLVVIQGGSSTGKTRSAYEAVMAKLPEWNLLYPRTAADLSDVLDQGIPSRTVLWLNELRHYIEEPIGCEAFGRLFNVLRQGAKIIPITTLWPDYWTRIMNEPDPGSPDPYLRPRLMLRGVEPIRVANEFTAAEMARLRQLARTDIVLSKATTTAHREGASNQIIQALAGAPDLLKHYYDEGGDAYGRALITAAIDARRLGYEGLLSVELLDAATQNYLTDLQRAGAPTNWFSPALSYAGKALKGAIRALEPVPPPAGMGISGYRLADYLEQHGTEARDSLIVPAGMWTALIEHTTNSQDQIRIASSAADRGLYQVSARLYQLAAESGDPFAARELAVHLERIGRIEEAIVWLRQAADGGDTDAARDLIKILEKIGRNEDAIERLFEMVDSGETSAIAKLADLLERSGRIMEAEACLHRAIEEGEVGLRWQLTSMMDRHGSVEDDLEIWYRWVESGKVFAMWDLADFMVDEGNDDVVDYWVRRAISATRVSGALDMVSLSQRLRGLGRIGEAEEWLRRAADIGDLYAQSELANLLESTGRTDEAKIWWGKVVDSKPPVERMDYLEMIGAAIASENAGRTEAAETLWRRVGELVPDALWGLVGMWDRTGHSDEAENWIRRSAVSGDANAMYFLAKRIEKSGSAEEAESWLRRAADAGYDAAIKDMATNLENMGRFSDAQTWLRRSAEAGNVSALVHLVSRYKVEGDLDIIERDLRHAAVAGRADALSALKKLLEDNGRSEEADLLERFGIEPGGDTSQPW
ncbi:hypothetical protein [Nonomuraea sp. NPDC005650]|uniref:tetratricopeptide repeat protein n=1 Tax=Nonomuraea sp. NPDC005650 TaxID=3157045 RepID=UPI0033A8D107